MEYQIRFKKVVGYGGYGIGGIHCVRGSQAMSEGCFKNWKPTKITYKGPEKYMPSEIAHEIGHALTEIVWPKINKPKNRCSDLEQFRKELVAWRIAKTFLKPPLWSEGNTRCSLKSYAKGLDIDIDRIKIIPWISKK